MGGSELIRLSYSQLPGLGVLQGFASWVMSLALLIWLLVEFYRLFTQGRADFVTPLVRVALGFALVHSIGGIGSALGTMFEGMSADLLGGAPLQLLGQAYSHAVGEVGDENLLTRLSNVISLKGLFTYAAALLYVSMFIIKVVMIDIAWPVSMSIVILLGLIAVQLGILPGFATISGWFRTLIEVALWPLVFQVIVGLMVSAFRGTLQNVAESQGVLGELVTSSGAKDGALLGDNFLMMVRFWAICVGYSVLCLATPFLAGMAVRSTPVSVIGGMVASKVASLAAAVVRSIPGSAKYASGAADKMDAASASYAQGAKDRTWGSGASPSSGATGGAGGASSPGTGSTGAATSLDQRGYGRGTAGGTQA